MFSYSGWARVTETEPGFKGIRPLAAANRNPRDRFGGRVPLFIERGDILKIDARAGISVPCLSIFRR